MIDRWAKKAVQDALSDTPVVLIHGPRQSGKSTLAESVGEGRTFVTLDDPEPLALAKSHPAEFLKTYRPPVTIDEIQRAPELFLAIKSFVDRNRQPGLFLLNGSANVMMLPKLADSLAGRMEIIDLHPLAQGELNERTSTLVDRLFESESTFDVTAGDDSLIERILSGGFPEPALRAPARRSPWFRSYVRTVLERDVRDLANIDGLIQLPRLLSLLAARTGSTLNVTALARDLSIPPTTLTRYLDLFKALFLIQSVPAWSLEEGARFAKSPKTYLVDTGLLCHLTLTDRKALMNNADSFGPILENFVANELAKHIGVSELRPWLLHLRTVRMKEVDFVLEAADGRIVGINVRATQTTKPEDADGLMWLQEIVGDRFVQGVVLHLGDAVRPIRPNICAVPIQVLWN